jgi:hypothetical protein
MLYYIELKELVGLSAIHYEYIGGYCWISDYNSLDSEADNGLIQGFMTGHYEAKSKATT